jgi:hypothetical protein
MVQFERRLRDSLGCFSGGAELRLREIKKLADEALSEQLEYNMLFRWFLDLDVGEEGLPRPASADLTAELDAGGPVLALRRR